MYNFSWGVKTGKCITSLMKQADNRKLAEIWWIFIYIMIAKRRKFKIGAIGKLLDLIV